VIRFRSLRSCPRSQYRASGLRRSHYKWNPLQMGFTDPLLPDSHIRERLHPALRKVTSNQFRNATLHSKSAVERFGVIRSGCHDGCSSTFAPAPVPPSFTWVFVRACAKTGWQIDRDLDDQDLTPDRRSQTDRAASGLQTADRFQAGQTRREQGGDGQALSRCESIDFSDSFP